MKLIAILLSFIFLPIRPAMAVDFALEKIPGTNLTMVMELVSADSLRNWQTFAYTQRKNSKNPADLVKLFTLLEKFDISQEIWIAYITNLAQPKRNVVKGYSLNQGMFIHKGNQIVMFGAIISKPEARLTSHLGMNVTEEENARQSVMKPGDPPAPPLEQLSLRLHAFAAKVMHQANQDRKYMIATTDMGTARQLSACMPHGIFIGKRPKAALIVRPRPEVDEEKGQGPNDPLLGGVSDESGEEDWLARHPPLIFFGKKRFNNFIAIYDDNNPQLPWLTIDKKNKPLYDWIIQNADQPSDGKVLIIANLTSLAVCAP